jgi:protein TonB
MKELYGLTPVSSKSTFKTGSWILSGTALLVFVFCIAFAASAATEYSASDVDSPPKIVRQMPVKYPAQAKKNGITGKVIVRCLVGVDGKAEKLEIVESEPAGIFDDSALSTLKYWQFRPGIKGGELVATWVKVPFKFE